MVVTDGKWKKPEKQPYAIAIADKSHMVMAGLWDEWTDKKTGERIKSCTIVTCAANALVGALHDRMPVVLAEEEFQRLKGNVTGAALVDAMQASPFRETEVEPPRGRMPVRDVRFP